MRKLYYIVIIVVANVVIVVVLLLSQNSIHLISSVHSLDEKYFILLSLYKYRINNNF